MTIDGPDLVLGMVVENDDFDIAGEQKNKPEKLLAVNISGMGIVKMRWLVSSGNRNYRISFDSTKGGMANWEKENK